MKLAGKLLFCLCFCFYFSYCQGTLNNVDMIRGSGNGCPGTKTYFQVTFTMTEDIGKCSFELRDTDTQQLIQSLDAFTQKTTYYTICDVGKKYDLTLKKSDTSGWKSNYVKVTLYEESTLIQESLTAGSKLMRFTFNVEYTVEPLFSTWRYYVADDMPIDKWNTVEGYQFSWPEAKPGTFPRTNSITQYYSILVDMAAITDFSHARFSVVLYAGAIFYINGYEIARINMPSGPVSNKDVAYRKFDMPTWYSVSDSIQRGNFVRGKNVFGIELHKYDANEETNSFDASVLLVLKNVLQNQQGMGTVSPVIHNQSPVIYAFDNNPNTIFINPTSCTGVSLQWSYINRREVITSYSLAASTYNLPNHPSGWNFEGSNDGHKWNMLNKQKDKTFTSGQLLTFDFYNEIPYSMYRLTSTQCKSESSFYLAGLYFRTKKIEVSCFSEDYPPTFVGEYSYASCPDYSYGYKSALCTDNGFDFGENTCTPDEPISITYPLSSLIAYKNKELSPFIPMVESWAHSISVIPSLPQGLSLNSQTGTISGKATRTKSLKQYTISVDNASGSIKTTLDIEVKSPSNGAASIIIVIIIIIVIVIVVIVLSFRIVKSRQMSRNISTRRELKRQEKSAKDEDKQDV